MNARNNRINREKKLDPSAPPYTFEEAVSLAQLSMRAGNTPNGIRTLLRGWIPPVRDRIITEAVRREKKNASHTS